MSGSDRTVRVALWQAEPGSGFDGDARESLLGFSPDVIVLPEYFWVRPGDSSPTDAAGHFDQDRELLRDLSRAIPAVWVGGTGVEPGEAGRLHNTCLVYDRGDLVVVYRKRRLMPGEAAGGIHPGDQAQVATVRGLRLGIMICADVFDPGSWDEMAAETPDLIAIPTNSPFRADDSVEAKYERDRSLFVAGARRTGAWVLKACTAGRLFGRPVQGRSLIAGPEGVLTRVQPKLEGGPSLLTAELPITARKPANGAPPGASP